MTPHAALPAPSSPVSRAVRTVRAIGAAALRFVERPVDPAGLAAFRVLFGVLVTGSALRFLASGFLDKLYVDGATYFRYPFFAWVPVLSADAIRAAYVAFAIFGVLIAVGLFFRAACASFTVLFAWVKLVDLTNYLNHDYLVILLAALLTLAPAHACFSVDALWRPQVRRAAVPFFWLAWLRVQVGCVYVFAALAKVSADWLVHAQPLTMWLRAKDELPLLGALLAHPAAPFVASWAGCLYDASIVGLLLWRRTRKLAYGLVLVFHGLTFALFEIGMFPFIMAVATTVFFDPSWPRALALPGLSPQRPVCLLPPRVVVTAPRTPVSAALVVIALAWCAVQVALPLRCHVLGANVLWDDVLWDEGGMRFSWRVMVRDKSGSLSYRVTLPSGRVVIVSPHDALTHRQVNEMVGQPDMILQHAHRIRDDFAEKGQHVQVRADALVSFNGRRARRFIDPSVDLAREVDGVRRPTWVLPAPTDPPPSFR